MKFSTETGLRALPMLKTIVVSIASRLHHWKLFFSMQVCTSSFHGERNLMNTCMQHKQTRIECAKHYVAMLVFELINCIMEAIVQRYVIESSKRHGGDEQDL